MSDHGSDSAEAFRQEKGLGPYCSYQEQQISLWNLLRDAIDRHVKKTGHPYHKLICLFPEKDIPIGMFGLPVIQKTKSGAYQPFYFMGTYVIFCDREEIKFMVDDKK